MLLGAPNAGAHLAELKFLVDLARFAYDLTGGLSHAIARSLPEGRGEMTLDLLPDSLFLRWLGRSPRLAARYHIIYGEYLDGLRTFALRGAFSAARRLMEKNLFGPMGPGTWRALGLRLTANLHLPEEVVDGDLLVSRRAPSCPGPAAPRACLSDTWRCSRARRRCSACWRRSCGREHSIVNQPLHLRRSMKNSRRIICQTAGASYAS